MSQQINLFNPIFLKQEKVFSAVTMAQALGLILLGCVGLAVYADHRLSLLETEAQSTTAQLGQVQAQLNKVTAAFSQEDKSKRIEEEIARAEGDVRGLQQVFETLRGGSFGNTDGYAEYMRAFARQIGSGIWLTGFDIEGAGNEIGLQGRALRPDMVPAYISRLRREPALQGKSFGALDMQTPSVELGEQAGQAGQANAKVAAPYIEFVLRSSVAREQAAGANK